MLASRKRLSRFSLIVLLLCFCVNMLLFRPTTSQRKLYAHVTRYRSFPVVQRSTTRLIERDSEWCQYYSEEGTLPAQVLSKEIIVRRVFFDGRKRGGFSHSIVFLVEAKGMTLRSKNFAGCRVGFSLSDKVLFRPAISYKFVQKYRHATSSLALIDCYGIYSVSNGDTASLFFINQDSVKMEIQSLNPLFVPKSKSATKAARNSTATAVVCVGMIRTGEHSPTQHGMLYHWLHYQKVIGVDHVHMAVENSFVRDGGLQHDVIQRAVREGYLSIGFWPFWLSPIEVFNSQKLAYQDCLYRFQGVYDYIIYADSDDFFVPVNRSKSIKHYLQRWCSGKTATCQFKWIQYFPDCGWDPKSVGADGNFTESMTYDQTMERDAHKSGHQLKALVDAGTHLANTLLNGYKQTEVPVDEAYFAHVRFGWLPTGGC